MTPIERAARALAHAESGVDEWHLLDEDFQETLKASVCAVLLALREPDGLMKHVGAQVVRKVHSEEAEAEFEDDAAMVWRRMIDAAVSDEVPLTKFG